MTLYKNWSAWLVVVGILLVIITASHLGFFRSGDIDYSGDDVLYEPPVEPVKELNNGDGTQADSVTEIFGDYFLIFLLVPVIGVMVGMAFILYNELMR